MKGDWRSPETVSPLRVINPKAMKNDKGRAEVIKSKKNGPTLFKDAPKAQCVELKLRWRVFVHTSTCPEIYF